MNILLSFLPMSCKLNSFTYIQPDLVTGKEGCEGLLRFLPEQLIVLALTYCH